ncbi:unnamed protein product, partial [Prorocentrum cordatum]
PAGGPPSPRPARASAAGMAAEVWEVVGGFDKGGILVREGGDSTSKQCEERLAFGALVKKVELRDVKLHYQLLLGDGPIEAGSTEAWRRVGPLGRTSERGVSAQHARAAHACRAALPRCLCVPCLVLLASSCGGGAVERGRRGTEPSEGFCKEPSEGFCKEPSEGFCKEPSEGFCKEPSEGFCKEPSEGFCKEPSEGFCKEPSEGFCKEPSEGFCKEPSEGFCKEATKRASVRSPVRASERRPLRGLLKVGQ